MRPELPEGCRWLDRDELIDGSEKGVFPFAGTGGPCLKEIGRWWMSSWWMSNPHLDWTVWTGFAELDGPGDDGGYVTTLTRKGLFDLRAIKSGGMYCPPADYDYDWIVSSPFDRAIKALGGAV